MPKGGGLGGVGVLTARLPLLHRSAGSTGALPHPIPPVTPADEENEEDGGVRSGGLRGRPSLGIKRSGLKFFTFETLIHGGVQHRR